MTHHPLITGVLLGVAVAIAIVSSIGVAVMRDAFQRIQFSSPVVSISIPLIAVAVWIEEKDPQARIKVILIWILLLVMNSILTHASARAFHIRAKNHWEPLPEDHIPVIGRDRPAEEPHAAKPQEQQ